MLRKSIEEFIRAIQFVFVILVAVIIGLGLSLYQSKKKKNWKYQLEIVDQNTVKLQEIGGKKIYTTSPDSIWSVLEKDNL